MSLYRNSKVQQIRLWQDHFATSEYCRCADQWSARCPGVRSRPGYIDADLVMRTHLKKTASRCLLRCTSSAPSDPSLCVNRHVPGVDGCSGCHTTRLRQRSLDQPSCLRVTASAVGLERRRVADLRLATLRPCVDALISILQHIQFKVAVLTYKVLHGCAIRPWSIRRCGRLTKSTSSLLRQH